MSYGGLAVAGVAAGFRKVVSYDNFIPGGIGNSPIEVANIQ